MHPPRPPRRCPFFAVPAVALLLLAGPPAVGGQEPILLRDVTAETGIAFEHTAGGSGERYIVEFVSTGLATFDYDGDGLIDVYFLNGAPLRGTEFDPASPPRNRLYRNNGDGTFTDVTEEAGVGDTGYGLGVVVGDYNNNGLTDIYVNNFGGNVLYRNNGDGTFTDVTRQAGVGNGHRVGAGAAFLDIDGDGTVDLYASNYLIFCYDRHDAVTRRGVLVSGPIDYQPDPDTLFRNNGDGTFTDVSVASGIARHAGTGMGMVCADFTKDGHTDVFIANDTMANYLFLNDGFGHFEEVGLLTGTAYNFAGMQQGNMGVDCGDFDNDGWLDLATTNYVDVAPVLYRNAGDGFFDDVTVRTGAGRSAVRDVTWGVGLVDFNNTGHRDLFIACGNLTAIVEELNEFLPYAVPNVLMMNDGQGRFVDVTASSGDGLAVVAVSRGAAFDDLSNNGRIDAVVVNKDGPPTILRNESPAEHHWIQVELEGVRANRGGVGAQVTVVAGDLTQLAEVHAGRGYQSHYGSRLHFGLGHRDRIDRIEVRWVGGGVDVFENPPVDRRIQLREGRGRVKGEG